MRTTALIFMLCLLVLVTNACAEDKEPDVENIKELNVVKKESMFENVVEEKEIKWNLTNCNNNQSGEGEEGVLEEEGVSFIILFKPLGGELGDLKLTEEVFTDRSCSVSLYQMEWEGEYKVLENQLSDKGNRKRISYWFDKTFLSLLSPSMVSSGNNIKWCGEENWQINQRIEVQGDCGSSAEVYEIMYTIGDDGETMVVTPNEGDSEVLSDDNVLKEYVGQLFTLS